MEADEAGSDSAIPPHTKHLLISAASCSVDQSSSSSSSVCGGLNTVPSNTQLHLAGHLAGGQNSCSDDSGCVVHTNSSISDSSRVYLNCKHDFELIESDGEVSQFDSLDNSEGGMSAENFNTLKKGPLVAPIDPPPEFQDSPQTTMLRRHTTTGYQEFAQLLIKDILGEAFLSILHKHNNNSHKNNNSARSPSGGGGATEEEEDDDDEEDVTTNGYCHHSGTVIKRTRISASDPQINVTSSQMTSIARPTVIAPENIYDEPSDSTRNSDDIEVDYYISKQLSASLARKKSSTLSANSQQLSLLRPNSRNSLQSRLSSSHNSLATTGACKVDDTTFITQAMSHDPLMSRQSIIDFYNVPLDSDIYALPVDMVLEAVSLEGEDKRSSLGVIGGSHRKSHHSRRLKFPPPNNGTSSVVGLRLSLLGGTSNSGSAVQGMSKSSEAKRRLFRKAQTKAASVSHSQLFHLGNNNNSSATSSASGLQVTPLVNAKRFSAPDGLGMDNAVAVMNHSKQNNNKKRGKREKRTSNTHHNQQHQVLPLSVHKATVVVSVTSDSSDEGGVVNEGIEAITTASSVQGNGGGGDEEREKEGVWVLAGRAGRKDNGLPMGGKRKEKEGKAAAAGSVAPSSKPVTITINKTQNPNSKGASNNNSNNKEKDRDRDRDKKAPLPMSTSFTSQSLSMQSNCAAIGGSGAATELTNGKPTKRETRDATKRGHNQFSTNLKQKFCSIFRFRNNKSSSQLAEYEYNDSYTIAAGAAAQKSSSATSGPNNNNNNNNSTSASKKSSAATIMLRALPPLPRRAPPDVPVTNTNGSVNGGVSGGPESNRRRPPAELPPQSPMAEIDSNNNDVGSLVDSTDMTTTVELAEGRRQAVPTGDGRVVDFASNLETIKQYGWYWGPISCQAAEKILSNEPDGSFIVRDSSDDHYIFSLTFKLNNCVRHVRIEQDKGTFSFGTLAKFKARTIVEFIEQALEYSRSGRYLFFLHRRPEHGPMRVQLKNPVSRFKHIQSLQHMCRFVIMKAVVRKDLISSLPLPNRLKDYLSYKNCYTEHFLEDGVGDGDVQGALEPSEGVAANLTGEAVATTTTTTITSNSAPEQEGN